MSEEPGRSWERGLVGRRLVEAPQWFHCWPSRGGISVLSPLGCSFIFLTRFVVVVSVCLVCGFSVVATCPSVRLPALLFVCVLFFVVCGCFIWRTRAELGAGVGRPPAGSGPPVVFIAGRHRAALLFWFFGGFGCGVLLFVVVRVVYKYKNN